MEAKLALARAIVARSHGEEAAARAEAHFTRVVREGQAPEEVPEIAAPDGDPVHLPAALAAAFGLSTSEARRLIGQGGVKVDGEVVRELDVPRGSCSKPLSKRESGGSRSCAYRLTEPSVCYCSSAARKGRCSKVPVLDNWSAFKHDRIRSVPKLWGLWCESEAFFRRASKAALVFENSTACVYVETSSSRRLLPCQRFG